jgi:ABC-type antimicrobial peptide transport system permease subunit
MDPGQPLAELTTAEAVLSGSLARPRFLAVITSAFGFLATLLALVAIGGAVAYAISGMKREIGIRVALGEPPRSVGLGILRTSLKPVLSGLVVGTVGALVLSRYLEGVLFGVAPRDPGTLSLSVLGLFAFALIACLMPIRRVGAVDPASALRGE